MNSHNKIINKCIVNRNIKSRRYHCFGMCVHVNKFPKQVHEEAPTLVSAIFRYAKIPVHPSIQCILLMHALRHASHFSAQSSHTCTQSVIVPISVFCALLLSQFLYISQKEWFDHLLIVFLGKFF